MASILDIFSGGFEAYTKPKVELPTTNDRNLIPGKFGSSLAEYLNLDLDKGPWLAGGAVRKFYLGQPLNQSDWDFWFSSQEQFNQAKEAILALGVTEVYSTDNAISYKFYEPDGVHVLQIIRRRFFDSAEDIINSFDFTVCQLVTDGRKMTVGSQTIPDIKNRVLRLTSNQVPSHIVPRMIKYMVYGYRPCSTLIEQIENARSSIDWSKQQLEYDAV
jgi:hypothetical protein